MDPYFIAIAARSVERIIGVLLGGLAIYFGYRLFMVLPVETRSDGKIELPGVSVVLSKAGPGLFFSAFGVIVVVTSLMQSIKIDDETTRYSGIAPATTTEPTKRSSTNSLPSSPTPQDLARINLDLQTLNCLPQFAASAPRSISQNDIQIAIRDAKLALLATAWDGKAWGDYAAFSDWAVGRTDRTTSPVKVIFESTRADCP